MTFDWLKRYMPRGLYGRTALILVVPVVSLQLAVSVVFISNHLRDVTTQMSLAVAREFDLVLGEMEGSESPDRALERVAPLLSTFQMQMRFDPPQPQDLVSQARWYDYSARVVRRTLATYVPGLRAIQFPDNLVVRMSLDTPLGPLQAELNRRRLTAAAPHQLFVAMVFFGGLMTVIAFAYLRNQLRPITRLANAAQAFGRGQAVAYSPSGAIEVRAAGSAFLEMRNRIERQIEQRTLMLSGVSHDLRTPLTRMRLGLAMLDDADSAPLLGDVEEMQHLIDAFLDFARDAGEGEFESVDPLDLVQRIVEDAQRAGSAVALGAMSGSGALMLRRLAIRRAVENLIGNAVRYGTRAEVSVVLSERSLRIRVEDNGPGIPPDQRADALKPFTRLDPARNQNKGSGVGLGLAIVSDVARAHGGVLRLGESERLGGLCADIVIAR